MSDNPYESPTVDHAKRAGWLVVICLPLAYMSSAFLGYGNPAAYEAGYHRGGDYYLSKQKQRRSEHPETVTSRCHAATREEDGLTTEARRHRESKERFGTLIFANQH
jgi:hypothetical protein